MANKPLTVVLAEERSKLMLQAYKDTKNYQDVADIFNTNRQIAYAIINAREKQQ